MKMTEIKPSHRQKSKLSKGKTVVFVILALLLASLLLAGFAYSRYLHPTGEIIPNIYSVC
jgi:hypothetical protein